MKRSKQSTPEIREQAKHFVLTLGVREAARQLGINEDTLCVWSHRYHWWKDHKTAIANSIPHPLKASASNADPVTTKSKRSRLNLARATDKATRHLSKLDGEQLVRPEMSNSAKNWSSTASTVFDWNKESPTSGIVSPLTVYSKQTVIGVSDSLGLELKSKSKLNPESDTR
jgi:transposase-like protein